MPFRQIAARFHVRRVSPYAISFMPFRQFVAACVVVKKAFAYRKHGIQTSETYGLQ